MKFFTYIYTGRPYNFDDFVLKLAGGNETFVDEDGKVYWGRRASGILFVRNHPKHGWQMLLTLRSGNVFDPNTWGIPGGAIPDNQDDSFESAMRETKEEIGTTPTDYRVIDEYIWQAPGGTFTYTTYIVQILDLTWEDYDFNWEVSDARWVSLDECQNLPLHPGVKNMLSNLKGNVFGEK